MKSDINPATLTSLSFPQGDVHEALIVLQKGVAQCFPDEQPLTEPRSLQTKGKAMLLVGRFMEETANFESNAIMKVYKVRKGRDETLGKCVHVQGFWVSRVCCCFFRM